LHQLLQALFKCFQHQFLQCLLFIALGAAFQHKSFSFFQSQDQLRQYRFDNRTLFRTEVKYDNVKFSLLSSSSAAAAGAQQQQAAVAVYDTEFLFSTQR